MLATSQASTTFRNTMRGEKRVWQAEEDDREAETNPETVEFIAQGLWKESWIK